MLTKYDVTIGIVTVRSLLLGSTDVAPELPVDVGRGVVSTFAGTVDIVIAVVVVVEAWVTGVDFDIS